MTHPRLLKSLAVALICTASVSGFAQVPATRAMRGAVTESATSATVAGAVIMLFDRRGVTTARTVSDAAGRYRVVATTSSTTLRVIRIGFTPTSRTLDAADTSAVDVELTRLPTLLTTMRVIDQPSCPADRNRARPYGTARSSRRTASSPSARPPSMRRSAIATETSSTAWSTTMPLTPRYFSTPRSPDRAALRFSLEAACSLVVGNPLYEAGRHGRSA